MDSLLATYEKPHAEHLELEIRIKGAKLDTISNLLTAVDKDYPVEHSTFIDAVNYKPNNIKIGLRTYLKDGKKVSTETVFKERIDNILTSNPITEYSVDLSIERSIPMSEVPANPSNILLKHRYSYLLPKHKDWQVDITITRKSELTSEGIKTAVKSFFRDVNSFTELIAEVKKRKFQYTFNIEIEHHGKNKSISSEEIQEISILPFKMVDENVEMKLYYIQELEYIRRTLTDIDSGRMVRDPTSLKNMLPQVKTLTRQQYNELFPPLEFMLTDKRDGIRTVINIHKDYVSILSDPSNIERHKVSYNKSMIIEGEAVTMHDGEKVIIIFDVLMIDDKNVTHEGIDKRVTYIPKVVSILNKITQLKFKEATYFILSNQQRYKSQFEEMFKTDRGYDIDGLILVKRDQAYLITEAYKWKPVEQQTIDFYCRKCPEELLGKKYYIEKEGHTLYLLFVGCSVNMSSNLQLPYIDGYKILFNVPNQQIYRPTAFATPLVPLSYLYYHPNINEDLDEKIIELSCEKECTEFYRNKFLVNWTLHRIRHDKVMIPGMAYGNDYRTAFYSFMNHIDPFPIEQLYQGSSKSDQYFKNVGAENNTYSAMRALMSYVKSQLISQYAFKVNRVLDIASGRGADLRRYIQLNSIGVVVVTDIDKAAITELFSRWLEFSRKSRTMINSSLRGVIMDVNDPAEQNINRITSVVDSSSFNTIFCHQAIHYFLESLDSIRNLAKLCGSLTIPGSHIIFTCPFGEEIFKKIGTNENWIGIESDMTKYKYERMYTDNKFEAAGQKIKVLLPFSASELYEEYLVNISTLEQIFDEQKMKLVEAKTMDNYLDAFNIHQKKVYDKLTTLDKENIGLYGVIIFKRY